MHRLAALCSSLLILVPASLAQEDSSTSSSTSSSSSSSSKRVVVINGETVVDEETRDGLPVRPGRGQAPARRAGAPGLPDLDELLERARANGGSYATGSADGSSHGGGRRIVLRDGEVVLDEEFGDLPAGSAGRRWMDETLEEMLRELGLDGGFPLPAGGAPTPPRGRSPIEWRYASTGQIPPELLDRLGERSGGLERPDLRPYREAAQPMPRCDLDAPPLPRRPIPLRTPTQAQGRVIH